MERSGTLTRADCPVSFTRRLETMFGDRYTRSAAVLEAHGRGETFHPAHTPDGVVFARSTEEVASLVRLCADYRVPVIPFGVGTSVEGNFAALHGGICLDLSQMNRILRVGTDDLDCTVEAGVTRLQLNDHLRDTGLFFPIDPGADATLGGMAATRASGTNAVRYGTMRDAVRSLKVVTASGQIIETGRRARKSAAGYDLTGLLVGSEGTLGVITEVVLRLHGRPEHVAAAACGFGSLEGAVATVSQLIQCGVPIARVELLDDVQMRAVNAWSKTSYPEVDTLFFEFHGSPAAVAEQVAIVEDLASANGGGAFEWATLPEDRTRLWKARHDAYYAALGLRPGAKGWATDVCVPIGRLAECVIETKRDLASAPFPGPILGHVGDGNFHVIFVLDPTSAEEMAIAERIYARLIERALSMDGTCTGEHGIGWGKLDWLEAELGDAVDLMRHVKRALDPLNIMNPGKVVRL